MSVVGNFNIQNYDRQEHTTGAGVQRRVSLDPGQGHLYDQRAVDGDEPERPPMSPEQREAEVHHLARQMTTLSTRTAENLFDYEQGGPLDPFSDKFEAKRWVKALAQLSKSEGSAPGRMSGISYRNMSVHGYGSDAGE
jgi:ATP-binding cassette, subfamily G (WHITE), member 2, PDR